MDLIDNDFSHEMKIVRFSAAWKSAAGVVVSCKIPILATRVRFPGDAHLFFPLWLWSRIPHNFAAVLHNSARVA